MSERNFYNAKQDREEHHLNKYTKQKLQLLNQWIRRDHPRVILDVGCGNGTLTNNLVTDHSALYGLDFSLSSLQQLNMSAICGDITRLPIRQGSVDLIICSEVLEHLDDITLYQAITQLQSLGAPSLIITVPNRETLGKNSIKCHQCGRIYSVSHHFQRFTPEKLIDLFSDYTAEEVQTCGRPVRPYIEYLLKIRQTIGNRWTYYRKPRYTRCPYCQTDRTAHYEANIISLLTDTLNALLTKKQPYWLCVRFNRK